MKLPPALQKLIPSLNAQGNPIRDSWDKLSGIPGGKKLFDKFIGVFVPYTGAMGAEVLELRRGYCKIQLRDRRAVRNHLDSVHAIALANLAEFAGNLAMMYSMPDDARFIVAGFTIEYLKKSRGTITAESSPVIPTTNEKREYPVEVSMRDESGAEVAHVVLRTLIGPKKG